MPYEGDGDEAGHEILVKDLFKQIMDAMQDLEEIWSPIGQGGIPYIRAMSLFSNEAAKIVDHATVAILSYTGRQDVTFIVEDHD